MSLRGFALLCAGLLSGCIIFDKKSEAVTFHQLSSPVAAATLQVAPIFIPRALLPSALRRPNVVLLDDTGWVRLEDAHRWVAPLDRAFSETLGRNLTQFTGRPTSAQSPSDAHLVLLLSVDRLSVHGEKEAILDLQYRLEHSDGTLIKGGALHLTSAMSEASPAQFVLAQSANITRAAQVIAKVLPAAP